MSSTAPGRASALLPGLLLGALLGITLGVVVIAAGQAAIAISLENGDPLKAYVVTTVCSGLACAVLVGWLVHTERIGFSSVLLAAAIPPLVNQAWSAWAVTHYDFVVLSWLSPVPAMIGIVIGLGAGLASRRYAHQR